VDPDDFTAAFDELFPRAYGLARRIVGDPAVAEDVAAEALARAYARWGKVSQLPWRDGWVLRVASNLAIDHVRRRPPEVAAFAPADEDAVTLRLALAACLQALPRRQRQAVALHYLAGLTDAEVGQALGISAGSVKTHIHRGMAALRKVAPLGLE